MDMNESEYSGEELPTDSGEADRDSSVPQDAALQEEIRRLRLQLERLEAFPQRRNRMSRIRPMRHRQTMIRNIRTIRLNLTRRGTAVRCTWHWWLSLRWFYVSADCSSGDICSRIRTPTMQRSMDTSIPSARGSTGRSMRSTSTTINRLKRASFSSSSIPAITR